MKKVASWVLLIVLGCIDPIDLQIDSEAGQLVVEGLITNEPGPHFVRLTRAQGFSDSREAPGISSASVVVVDDLGNRLIFNESSPGLYLSDSSLVGVVGRTYTMEITLEGQTYRSQPETLEDAPPINRLYYEFENRTVVNENNIEVDADGFSVLVDTQASSNQSTRFRWTWTGTYRTETNPELRVDGMGEPDPLPCSGFIINPNGPGITPIDTCSCCECWVTETNRAVTVSNSRFINEAGIQGQAVAFIGVDTYRFLPKYHIEVVQYSLTEQAFEFWNLVSLQQQNRGTIFDTPPAVIRGNITNVNNLQEVIFGYFGASVVSRSSLYIFRSSIPYSPTPPGILAGACQALRNGSNQRPDFWED